jgi:3',5'-cyclic AMP phosphodiesterase CpdA
MAGDMVKFLVFSDLHLVEDGVEIIGLDPLARFRDGLEHALAQHPDASRLVLLGDLTHHGRTAQYQRLRDALDGLALPISFLLGNHDNRATFRRVFAEVEATSSGHIQQMVDLGPACLITLDTLDDHADPKHSGRLCADRLAWLERALTWAAGRPVVVALHHPPFATGFAGMDAIALQDPAPLYALLKGYPGAVQLLCGHIHRTISGQAEGLPFSVFKSPCDQMPMRLGDAGSAHSVAEPGAYGIVLVGAGGVIVHSEDFAIAAAASLAQDITSA